MPIYTMLCDQCAARFDVEAPIADGAPTWAADVEHYCGDDPVYAADASLTQVVHAPVIHGVGESGARRDWSRVRTKDADAYRRLRKDGLQPKSVDGSAEIEQRAGEKVEVEQDVVYENRKSAHRAQVVSNDLS